MLVRFSLYGFLKNQRYFEPFLVLALLDKGLSFFQIGLLIGIREIVCILLEMPSGAIADTCGRRGSMIVSFAAYLLSFLTLGLARHFGLFACAMVCYGVGEAFRTGTHKAMIFAWLREQGREDERTRVYGYTRSWSKIGSAVSGVLAALFVFVLDGYSIIFFASMVPCVLSMINLMGYPASLEGDTEEKSPTLVWVHLRTTLRAAFTRARQRRLIFESMGFEGLFAACKDLLQPVLAAAAIGWFAGRESSEVQQTAILVGPVYMVLFLMSAFASRRAHKVVAACGGEAPAARRIWWFSNGLFLLLTIGALLRMPAVMMVAFIGLHVLQNIWRPILISRFDEAAEEKGGATTLSIESQAKRLATMILAPLLGLAVDAAAGGAVDPMWPVGVVGCLVACLFLAKKEPASPIPAEVKGAF